MIEAIGTFTSKLQMLTLVMTDRDMSGSMDEDIGGLEYRIGE